MTALSSNTGEGQDPVLWVSNGRTYPVYLHDTGEQFEAVSIDGSHLRKFDDAQRAAGIIRAYSIRGTHR